MVVYVVKSSRIRHTDRSCPVLGTIDQHNADAERRSPPTQYERRHPIDPFEAHVATLQAAPGTEIAEWIETFTTPCTRCVPGASQLWQHKPY